MSNVLLFAKICLPHSKPNMFPAATEADDAHNDAEGQVGGRNQGVGCVGHVVDDPVGDQHQDRVNLLRGIGGALRIRNSRGLRASQRTNEVFTNCS